MTKNDVKYNRKAAHKTAAFMFGSNQHLIELQQIAEPLGCSISDHFSFGDVKNWRESPPTFDLLFIDLTSDMEIPLHELTNISDYLEISNAEALVWTNLKQIEAIYPILPVSKCDYMVGVTNAEAMLIMSRAIRRGTMSKVYEGRKDFTFRSLNRLSEELSDFARTLARVAEMDERTSPTQFSEKPVSFRAAPRAVMHPIADVQASAPQSITSVRETIKLRRLRDKFFDPELFADPAWDILLDLYAARLDAITVSVSSLCIAASVPATTALRWISGMTDSGMLVRRHDPKDARRVFIELSDEVAGQMTAYFTDISGKAGRSI